MLDEVPAKTLTQKEYFIAVRNRLFAVEEQIWIHDYLEAHKDVKLKNISKEKLGDFQAARADLLREYPLSVLYSDLKAALKQGDKFSYAALYIERLIENVRRVIPIPLDHVNQIAVISSSAQVSKILMSFFLYFIIHFR